MEEKDVEKFINNKSKDTLIVLDEKEKKEIKYTYINTSKNYIYYRCEKRCGGLAKIDKNKKIIIIYRQCDQKTEHNKINFSEYSIFANKSLK